MATINVARPELSHDGQNPPRILNFETVASYNWLEEPEPTILVPGIPPIWDPPQIAPVLKLDTGGRSVDQDADRTPGSPLQALILAVQTCQPGFDFTSVDIVTDRRPLRCLLSFVRGEPAAFRFGVTVLDNSALFTRMETVTRYQLSTASHGYRDAFEEHYTKNSASTARATSHHRVVKYEFAGQTILLRYAVDAYLRNIAKPITQDDDTKNTDVAPLVKRHKNMNIKGDPPSKTLPVNTLVTAIHGGRHIPHAATLEFTTRAQHSQAPDSIELKMPEFWISQTLNYHLCFHREKNDGSKRSTIFNRIRLIPMADLLIGWEKTNEEKLRALAHVLRQVIEAAKELGGSCIVSFDGSKGKPLEVSRAEREEVPALPENMRSLFLPVKNEAVDVLMKQEDVATTACTAGQEGTRKRKHGADDAPKLTGSPPARRIALDSAFRSHREAAVPTQDGEAAKTASNKAYDGTRKRKIDAEDAPELTDSPPSRKRALNWVFRTPGHTVAAVKAEEPSVELKDEQLDSEMTT